ncbi:hypothetical protein MSAN_01039900 [Mycena sanguinolenta]|uniref:Uncharacterized protein n=1 Tax=Mycena sanguinolenta TaxID=230812 RepID=A0A8H7D735_9AGAR|nr:hypothetical protein MSAN_01039900 [Mycena sanguinolenta]
MSSFLQLLWEAPLVDAAEALGMFPPQPKDTPLQKAVLLRKMAPHLFPQPPSTAEQIAQEVRIDIEGIHCAHQPLAASRRERLEEAELRKKLQCEAIERQRRERSKEEILKFVEENRILILGIR